MSHPFQDIAEKVWIKDSLWHAPSLWISEFRSVALKYRRAGLATLKTCENAIAQARIVMPFEQRHEPDDVLVMRLAAESGCSVYDCEFVAVAETLDVPLLTWDSGILKAFPQRATTPEKFVK